MQVLFSKSLRDNIRYADPSASEAAVREAAARADALPFIEELPEKYDAVLATGMQQIPLAVHQPTSLD